MTATPATTIPPPSSTVSFASAARALARDPMQGFESIGQRADGALTRVNLGASRPFLAIHPDHVQHVLRQPTLYRREGMLWKPIQRLEGHGIAGEGEKWQTSRRLLQTVFSARRVNHDLMPGVVASVNEALDSLAATVAADPDTPVDLLVEMMRITHRVLIRVFFGSRIADGPADRLGRAIADAFESLSWRLLFPFVPNAVPMPGDRRFRRSVRIADEVIFPLIAQCRAEGAPGQDLVSLYVSAVDSGAVRMTDQEIRDDLVGMFVAGTETSALALTWLWLLLNRHPQVGSALSEEARAVAPDGVLRPEHVTHLTTMRMALQETLRLYPVGWVVPRTLAAADTIGGTRIPAKATVVLSPYLTHRLPAFWPDPERFVPQRFADGQKLPHKFAYIPFGAGVHQCLGNHLFLVESALAAAGVLARWTPQLVTPQSMRPRPTASLRPHQRAFMRLRAR